MLHVAGGPLFRICRKQKAEIFGKLKITIARNHPFLATFEAINVTWAN
jgi:hypothetical protein